MAVGRGAASVESVPAAAVEAVGVSALQGAWAKAMGLASLFTGAASALTESPSSLSACFGIHTFRHMEWNGWYTRHVCAG